LLSENCRSATPADAREIVIGGSSMHAHPDGFPDMTMGRRL
jgi:hypothetical protein